MKQMNTSTNFRNINKMVDDTMEILDQDFSIPENLADKIMSKHIFAAAPKRRTINYSIYAQIAAVLVAGVFLGVVLGKNADVGILLSKETKKQRSLIEYKASHHLFVDCSMIHQ